jgi:hypothetical protein
LFNPNGLSIAKHQQSSLIFDHPKHQDSSRNCFITKDNLQL